MAFSDGTGGDPTCLQSFVDRLIGILDFLPDVGFLVVMSWAGALVFLHGR